MSNDEHDRDEDRPPRPPEPPKAPEPPQPPEPPEPPRDDDYRDGDDPSFFGRNGPFGEHGMFGPDGPFGPRGPFGDDGPFGPGGVFGPSGPFGEGGKWKFKGQRSHDGERPHGGPKRRGRMFGPGELRLVLLALIAEEPRHGYDCIRALEDATGGDYAPSPGVIYPTLSMLVDEGLITERQSDDARKVYETTEAGREELERNREDIERLLERIGRKVQRAQAARSSDMMRAMGNLASVLTNAASRGRLNSDNRERIVDLIDELARKIERL